LKKPSKSGVWCIYLVTKIGTILAHLPTRRPASPGFIEQSRCYVCVRERGRIITRHNARSLTLRFLLTHGLVGVRLNFSKSVSNLEVRGAQFQQILRDLHPPNWGNAEISGSSGTSPSGFVPNLDSQYKPSSKFWKK